MIIGFNLFKELFCGFKIVLHHKVNHFFNRFVGYFVKIWVNGKKSAVWSNISIIIAIVINNFT